MPKPNSYKFLTIQTLAFRTAMPAARFRQLIEGAVAADPLLNESFIVGEDPSIFRLHGMHQHGDVLLTQLINPTAGLFAGDRLNALRLEMLIAG